MDFSTVSSQQAKSFLSVFLRDRAINKEVYSRVPEDQLDFRMVNTPTRKSDSPRESIAHQIYVTRKYIYGVKTGVLRFDGFIEKQINPQLLTKQQLIDELTKTEDELISLLSEKDIDHQLVKVPWSKEPISAVQAVWGLRAHEVLHIGWNLAIMDHLNIERFPLLKEVWG